MIPKRNEVIELAKRQWHSDRAKTGDPSFDINPELSELYESGYLASAKSSLMHNLETQHAEWINGVSETSDFEVDVDTLFESNALILGSRHTGKSDLAMMICDKAMPKNAIVVCFDPSLDWVTRSSIKQYVKVEPHAVLDVSCESVIYDMSLCSPLDQQKIVENFARILFEHQAQASNRKQYLLIFEESHTYFYQNVMRSKNAVNSVRMLSVGRNVGIACLLISQFASFLDKFCVKHSLSQAWFGFSKEPNDLAYLKQILGSDVKELPKLKDGEFVYLTRKGLSKIHIESYESQIVKTEVRPSVSQCAPIEPIKSAHLENTTIALLKFGMLAFFALLFLKVLI